MPTDALEAFDLLSCPLDRRVLIEASAGTGKTWTLCMLVLRLLLEAEYRLDQILIVTFTEAATAELRGRIRARLREALLHSRGQSSGDPALAALVDRAGEQATERIERALASMDQARITTLHGFCQQVLQGWPLLSGSPFSPELLEDQGPLLAELVQNYWRERLYHADETRQRLLLQSEGLQPHDLRELFAGLLGQPADGMTLLPECPPFEPLPDLWPELQQRFSELRPLWQAERAAIEALLSEAITQKRLKGNSYRLNWLPGLLAQADRCFAAPYLALPLPDGLAKLTASGLEAALNKNATAPSHAFFTRLDGFWHQGLQLAEAGRAERLRLSHDLAATLRTRLEDHKRSRGIWAFDDLLLNVLAALRGPLGGYLADTLRQAWPVALIDEFQDTDRIQSEIFRRIYPNADYPLFLIGDPKQSIYRFRGADIFAYFAMAAEPGLQRYSLARNHRSRPAVLAGAARFFSQPEVFKAGHASLPAIAYPDLSAAREHVSGTGITLWLEPEQGLLAGAAHQRVASASCAEIRQLVREGVDPSDIAVLTRSHRQARLVQSLLLADGIPALVFASDPVYTSREAWELELLLDAVLWPADAGRLKRALGTCLLGYEAGAIAALRSDEGAWDTVVERFGSYQRIWRSKGLAGLWLRLERDEQLPLALAAYPDGERRIANLRHLIELMLAQAEQPGMSPGALLDWLRRQRAAGGGDSAQQRLESEAAAVRVLTVHRSKGLEFGYVFCPWLWDEGPGDSGLVSAYDSDSGRKLIWLETLTAEQRRESKLAQRQRIEQQAEGLRLAYVAITRARERCYLAWIWQFENSRSGPCAWSPLACLLGLAGESLGPEAMSERITAYAGEGLEVLPMPQLTPGPPLSPGNAAIALSDRAFTGKVPSYWRNSSYTSLIASLPEPDAGPAAVTQTGTHAIVGDGLVSLEDLPGGSRTGTYVHHLLEHTGFKDDPETLDKLIRQKMPLCPSLRGFEPALSALLTRALRAPLHRDLPGLQLAALTHAWRELPFQLPLQGQRPGELQTMLNDFGLAPLGEPGLWLPQGQLGGRLDLVFAWEGKYYVLDYKSSWLGPEAADYAPTRIGSLLRDSGQLLQGLIYALALHRQLGMRLPDYRPERDFGGVFYLYLRGLEDLSDGALPAFDPEIGTSRGVWYLQPGYELLAALSERIGEQHGQSGPNPVRDGGGL